MVNYNEVHLKQTIKAIAINENFSKDANIQFSKGRKKGEGYLGDIVRVDIEENGRVLNLVVKVSMKSESIRATVPVSVAYGNEIEFYERIYPALDELQRERETRQPLDLVPRFFKSCGNDQEEFLILENLTELGYRMMDPNQYIDGELCRIIFRAYAKFHALSFALKYVKPLKYGNLVEKLSSIDLAFKEYKGGFTKQLFEVIQSIMDDMACKNDFIDYYVENAESILEGILLNRKGKYSCIVHCDGWSNNFMLKYKDRDSCEHVEHFKLLDWQACCDGSPVMDLSYVLYAGASKEVLDKLDVYLKVYHNAMAEFLSQMKLDVDLIYPFHILKEHWQTYSAYGVIRGLMSTKVKLTNIEAVVDPAECQENVDFFETIVYGECDKKKLTERVEDLTNHLKDIGVWK